MAAVTNLVAERGLHLFPLRSGGQKPERSFPGLKSRCDGAGSLVEALRARSHFLALFSFCGPLGGWPLPPLSKCPPPASASTLSVEQGRLSPTYIFGGVSCRQGELGWKGLWENEGPELTTVRTQTARPTCASLLEGKLYPQERGRSARESGGARRQATRKETLRPGGFCRRCPHQHLPACI